MDAKNAAVKAVHLRMNSEVRNLIDRAASARGKSRSDFMVEAAAQAAQEALLDQVYFEVGTSDFEALAKLFDQPASGVGFAKLMSATKLWVPIKEGA